MGFSCFYPLGELQIKLKEDKNAKDNSPNITLQLQFNLTV